MSLHIKSSEYVLMFPFVGTHYIIHEVLIKLAAELTFSIHVFVNYVLTIDAHLLLIFFGKYII